MRIFFYLALFSFSFSNATIPSSVKKTVATDQKKKSSTIPQIVNASSTFFEPSYDEKHHISDLITACHRDNYDEVARLLTLPLTVPTPQALKAAFERDNLKIADLLISHLMGALLIQKKMFSEYCRPHCMNVAQWILQHGYEPLSPSHNPS